MLGRRAGNHHRQPSKKLPDSAVLELRREYEAASKRGERSAIVRKYAALYGASAVGVRNIAEYRCRSSWDRPLDPSLK